VTNELWRNVDLRSHHTLFDKSAVQSLNVDEAVWFDNFYRTVISSLFFVEALADLSKEVPEGRTPEQGVGNIVAKTPETGSVVSVNCRHLRLAGPRWLSD
jgi:hypothetical protein